MQMRVYSAHIKTKRVLVVSEKQGIILFIKSKIDTRALLTVDCFISEVDKNTLRRSVDTNIFS